MAIQLSERQKEIIEIVRQSEPITSQEIAETLGLTRAALRPDLTILTMANILDAKPRVGYCLTQPSGTAAGQLDLLLEMKVGELQSHPVVVREERHRVRRILRGFRHGRPIAAADRNGVRVPHARLVR